MNKNSRQSYAPPQNSPCFLPPVSPMHFYRRGRQLFRIAFWVILLRFVRETGALQIEGFFFKSSRRKKFGNKLYEIRFLFRRNKRTYTWLPARDFSRFAKLDRNVSRRVPILLQAQFFELKASIQAKLDFMMSQALCKQRVCTFGRNAST